MKIGNNVEMLQIKGPTNTVYPVLLGDANALLLVDTAYPGLWDELSNEVGNSGFGTGQIKHLIFTHHDIDHIGCIKEAEKNTAALLYAHKLECPYISGESTPLKLVDMAGNDLTDDKKAWLEQLRQGFIARQTQINNPLSDGDLIDFGGGILVLHTPGHTHGHICLYIKEECMLVAGDALNISDGKLSGPNPIHTHDLAQAHHSLKKLLDLDIKKIVCFHGGLFEGDCRDALQKIIGC